MQVKRVIISIPAYNEEETLGPVIDAINAAMKKTTYSHIIQVVNDGSKDKTAQVAEKHGAKVFSHPRNMGLAETFRTEVEQALKLNFDVFVHTDADGQYLASDIPRLIKEIEDNNADLAMGSRFLGKIEEMPLLKRWGNKSFSRVLSKITRLRITDGQTGFRAFTREVAEQITITSFHTYTQEQIIRAARKKYSIKEIPIFFAKRGGDGKSRLMSNPFDYAIKAWINILRIYRDYEPLKFFGYAGGSLMVLGGILALYILFTFIQTGNVGGIPRVILSALLLLSGVQVILFGFLADMIRK